MMERHQPEQSHTLAKAWVKSSRYMALPLLLRLGIAIALSFSSTTPSVYIDEFHNSYDSHIDSLSPSLMHKYAH